ncbi:MAG: GC-type dockerin domain-anchored protein [Phycisphaerales bacterium]
MRTPALALLMLATLAGSAMAQTYTVPVNSVNSSMSTNVQAGANTAGSFRGNYIQATNPTGTRVVNLVIIGQPAAAPTNLTKTFTAPITANTTSPIQTHPTGRYALVINEVTRRYRLQCLNINLLGDTNPRPTVPVNATISYQSFSTVAPRYDYPFLFPIPTPLGEATVSTLTAEQSGSVSGTLTQTGPGTYTFSASVPCILRAELDFSGSPIDSGPIAQSLAVSGTVNIGNASIFSTLTMDLGATQTNNTPVVGTPDQPFAFPAPPTAPANSPPANMLLTLTINSSTVTTSGSTTLPANGPASNLADVAGLGGAPCPDGQRTADDVVAFLAAFFSSDPLADVVSLGGGFGPDGQFTADDVVAFLSAFF